MFTLPDNTGRQVLPVGAIINANLSGDNFSIGFQMQDGVFSSGCCVQGFTADFSNINLMMDGQQLQTGTAQGFWGMAQNPGTNHFYTSFQFGGSGYFLSFDDLSSAGQVETQLLSSQSISQAFLATPDHNQIPLGVTGFSFVDPPGVSVPEPWGWVGLIAFCVVLCGMLAFSTKDNV